MTDPISLLFGSDFHFGIPSINQQEMATAFASTIFPLLSKTDIFLINGDFFDTLVPFDGHGFDPIYDTIMDVFALCEKHQIILRLLQGTWEHDRNQCKRFEAFYRKSGYTFNYRYAGNIELEEIKIRNRTLRFLFVPDDLPFRTSDDIVEVIQNKLTEIGWDYVDYGCMHGFFDFTFPANVSQENVKVFKEAQFPFVRKMIDVGHVHQHRIQGNVISNGSFDRMVFGDEDPKGLIKVLDYPDHYTAQFVENKNAAVFDTMVFTKEDTTETIRFRITEKLNSLQTNRKISLRFQIEGTEHRDAIKSWMKEIHPEVYCRFKRSDEVDGKPIILSDPSLFVLVQKRIAPTPKTIASFVRSHIPEDYVLSIDQIDAYLEPNTER